MFVPKIRFDTHVKPGSQFLRSKIVRLGMNTRTVLSTTIVLFLYPFVGGGGGGG